MFVVFGSFVAEGKPNKAGLFSFQTYDDTELCTWVDSAMNWNMQTTRYSQQGRSFRAPFDGLSIVGVKTMVYADQSTPEIFNISRQFGFDAKMAGREKPGGYSSLTWWDDDTLHMEFDRGHCWQADCSYSGTDSVRNFYMGTFPYTGSRSFTNTSSKKRASMLIDYVCEDAESSPTNVHTMWKKLDVWDMADVPSRALNISSDGITSSLIVDLSATIHSDPNENEQIQIDNLEHANPRYSGFPAHWRGRGGILWLGYGCRSGGECAGPESFSNYRLRLYAGPGDNGTGLGSIASSYRNDIYWPDPESSFEPLEYKSTDVDRGWVKIRYMGTRSSTKIPYAMKTRVMVVA